MIPIIQLPGGDRLLFACFGLCCWAVWKESIPMLPLQREHWLSKVAATRLDQLAESANRHTRLWQSLFPGIKDVVSLGWLDSYTGFS